METFRNYHECVDYIKNNFILEINDAYTMAGIIINYLPKLRANWCDATTQTALSQYIWHILPVFADQALDEYDVRYCKDVWERIRKTGPLDSTNQSRTVPKPYSPEYMGRIRFLIRHVVLVGSYYGACKDFLYGTDFSRPEYGYSKKELKKKKTRIAKAFSALMEYLISEEIFMDFTQDGEKMLLLNMYLTAVRNIEAAAVPWNCLRQVDTFEHISALWIEYSKEGRTTKDKVGGKTSNLYRFSVFSQKAKNFYLNRKKYITEQVRNGEYKGTVEEVDNWPIGCRGKCWDQPCTAQQVTAAAAELFKKITLTEDDLLYLELEMEYMENKNCRSTDLTAYVFRRACATRYYHLGMTPDERLYLMGHSFGSKDKRKSLSNPDSLKRMYDKIIMHPIVGDLDLNDMTITMEGKHLDVVVIRDQEVVIPCNGQKIEIEYIPYDNASDGTIFLESQNVASEADGIAFTYKNKKTDKNENEKYYLHAEYYDLYREGLEAYKKLKEKPGKEDLGTKANQEKQ